MAVISGSNMYDILRKSSEKRIIALVFHFLYNLSSNKILIKRSFQAKFNIKVRFWSGNKATESSCYSVTIDIRTAFIPRIPRSISNVTLSPSAIVAGAEEIWKKYFSPQSASFTKP